MGSKTFDGVWFTSFSNDHEPPHVHGQYSGTTAIIDLLPNGQVAKSSRSKSVTPANAKRSDVRRIVNTAKQHALALQILWEMTHG